MLAFIKSLICAALPNERVQHISRTSAQCPSRPSCYRPRHGMGGFVRLTWVVGSRRKGNGDCLPLWRQRRGGRLSFCFQPGELAGRCLVLLTVVLNPLAARIASPSQPAGGVSEPIFPGSPVTGPAGNRCRDAVALTIFGRLNNNLVHTLKNSSSPHDL